MICIISCVSTLSVCVSSHFSFYVIGYMNVSCECMHANIWFNNSQFLDHCSKFVLRHYLHFDTYNPDLK